MILDAKQKLGKLLVLVSGKNSKVYQRGAGILDSLVDYEGYSISSKEFLPTVVDINGHLT